MKLLKFKTPTLLLIGALSINVAEITWAGAGNEGHTHEQKNDVALKHNKVTNNISVVMGKNGFAGGNVAVSSGPDGLLIVDDLLPGFQHKLEKILSLLNKCESCDNPKYLINTHWHFDHTGTNEHFGNKTAIISHKNTRSLLAVEQTVSAMNKVFPALKPVGLPDITFVKESSIYFNGDEIEMKHFPKSHTSGDIVAYFKQSKVLHLGDLYFNGMFPFVDLEHGGNVKGMINSIKLVLAHYPAGTKIIPGHGPVTDMKGLKNYLKMLTESTNEVEKMKKSGMSLEDIQKQGINKRWASWSWKLINTKTWIKLIFHSL